MGEWCRVILGGIANLFCNTGTHSKAGGCGRGIQVVTMINMQRHNQTRRRTRLKACVVKFRCTYRIITDRLIDNINDLRYNVQTANRNVVHFMVAVQQQK